MHEGLNYLGLIDDVVHKYPWRFKVSKKRLLHSLATQVIDGRPILLNDGYLIHHPVAHEAMSDENHLLWVLLKDGFVKLFARGGENYSLAETPVKMAHIESFRKLLKSPIWPTLKRDLEKVEKTVRKTNSLVPWTKYDAGSGFLAQANRLKKRLDEGLTSPWSLGLGFQVSKTALEEFLKRFIGRMENDLSGPRDYWEHLAEEVSEDRDYTVERPDKFVLALMRLANEMYHYNQGVMLAASNDEPISVETQTSQAFDDLIAVEDILFSEIPLVSKLNVPMSIVHATPEQLVTLLDPSTKAGAARVRWISARDNQSRDKPGSVEEAKDAGEEYSRRIAEKIGANVRYSKEESVISFVVSAVASAGAVAIGTPSISTGVIGFAGGYLTTKIDDRITGSVTKKFRILKLKKDLKKPFKDDLVSQSQKIIRKIRSRKVPSSLLLNKDAANDLAQKIKKFTPK